MREEGPLARRARLAAEKQSGGGALAERARRAAGVGADDLFRERGQTSAPQEPLRLDVEQRPESTRALPHNRLDRDVNLGGLPEGATNAALAMPLVAAQAFPGAELFESAMGSLGSQFTDKPMSIRESRDALRSVTDNIPTPIKVAVQAPGIIRGGAALGAVKALRSPMAAGAAIGAADQVLSADDMSAGERAFRTGLGAAGGAAIGGLIDAGTTAARALKTKGTGANAIARQSAMQAADRVNYGAAAAEGMAAANTTPIATVLQSPDIKPFADMVRQSRKYSGAHETTILRETYKLMSKQQGGLSRQLKEQGFDAAKQLQHDNIGLAKDELLRAADQVMPSFRKAVEAHAKMAGEIDAIEIGAKAARRAGGAPATARLRTQSQEALEGVIRKMPAGQREAAIEGILGDVKKRIRPNANPISGFGAFAAVHRPARIAAMLRNLADQKQMTIDQLVRSGLLGAATLDDLMDQ